MLSDPSQAGFLRERLFHDRAAVDEYPIAERTDFCGDPIRQPLQAPPQVPLS